MTWMLDERWSEIADAEVWRDPEAGLTVLIAEPDAEDDEP